jgi:CHRD domain
MRYRMTTVQVAVAAAIALAGASTAIADGKPDRSFSTTLIGYNETPLTLNSPGSGTFKAKLSKDGSSLDYTLTFSGLTSNALQAHVHFGAPAITGQIILFLCTNLGNAPSGSAGAQPCPVSGGTVTGTLTAADVIARPTQNIHTGVDGFAEILAAMGVGAAYANVHTVNFPSGEIRGAVNQPHDQNDDND